MSTYSVHCKGCGWSIAVDKPALVGGTPLEESAKKRAAAHASATGCAYSQIEIGEDDDE